MKQKRVWRITDYHYLFLSLLNEGKQESIRRFYQEKKRAFEGKEIYDQIPVSYFLGNLMLWDWMYIEGDRMYVYRPMT